MAVNSVIVQKHIADFLARFKVGNQLQTNEQAFLEIKHTRNTTGDSEDESLAAAEHYLLSRYMVSNALVSVRQMTIMVYGYDGIKAVAQLNSYTEMKMRHNPLRPTSKVSMESIAWGIKGIADGELDKKKLSPGTQAPLWNWEAMKFGGATDAVASYGAKVSKHY